MNMKITSGLLSLLFSFLASAPFTAQTPGSLDAQFGTAGTAQIPFLTFAADCRAMVLQPDGKIVLGGLYTSGGTANMAFARLKTNGQLDDTQFGTGGKTNVPIGATGVKLATLQMATGGKIIAAGSNANKPAILRLNSNGTTDNTFGVSGLLEFDGGLAGILDLVVLSNGKMVGCGLADQAGVKKFAAFRLNANGTPDATFGTAGFSYIDVGEQPLITRMAVQPDGKILLTGLIYFNTTKYDLVLLRLSANGAPDNTFGTSGKVVTTLSTNNQAYEQGNAIAVQSDGKIVVAARIANAGPTVFSVVRYNANGSIDTPFGTSGSTSINFNNSIDEAKAITIQPDGKIVVAGSSVSGSERYVALARLNTNGSLDNTFDSDGKVTTKLGTKAYGEAIAIQADGKIVVGGYATINTQSQLVALRYHSGLAVGTQEPESTLRALTIFPNPVSLRQNVTVEFELETSETCQIKLFGPDGRLLHTYSQEYLPAGKQRKQLELPAGIPAGQLTLQVETASGTRLSRMVILN